VLGNEMNQTTPITFNLSETGNNKRIIFELYKLHPETGDFNYGGEWTQLWLNVTRP
jgi:hypothetical protein